LSDDEVEQVRLAGRLHDIGKIGTREGVMNKQGPLTPDDYDHVKQHVIIGSQILAPLEHLGPVLGAVRSHHERWDGAGYPDGLRGAEIPITARIIGAAEVYDALSTTRPYQAKLSTDQAVRRMGELVETVLDPKVFAALAEVVTRRRSLVFLEGGEGP
jgi:HD-GYP domain-containing protein (c-di-GMP phosphodiesterase class II)